MHNVSFGAVIWWFLSSFRLSTRRKIYVEKWAQWSAPKLVREPKHVAYKETLRQVSPEEQITLGDMLLWTATISDMGTNRITADSSQSAKWWRKEPWTETDTWNSDYIYIRKFFFFFINLLVYFILRVVKYWNRNLYSFCLQRWRCSQFSWTEAWETWFDYIGFKQRIIMMIMTMTTSRGPFWPELFCDSATYILHSQTPKIFNNCLFSTVVGIVCAPLLPSWIS